MYKDNRVWLLFHTDVYNHLGVIKKEIHDTWNEMRIFNRDAIIHINGHDDSENKFRRRRPHAQEVIIIDEELKRKLLKVIHE